MNLRILKILRSENRELKRLENRDSKIEKSSITRVWNILEPTQSIDTGQTIYHPLHDKGSIGIFLKGFFGYNSNPNIPEVILWIVALFFGLNMWRRFYF